MNTFVLKEKFLQGVRWNFLEAVVYQLLYVTHYGMLFRIVDLPTYGTIGIIFSTLYLVVSLCNGGMEQTLALFYPVATESKKTFNLLLKNHFIFQAILFLCITCLYLTLFTRGDLTKIAPLLTLPIVLSTALLFITEGIRKLLRTLLHYAFFNSITARIEILSLAAYVSGIWTYYMVYKYISLEFIVSWFCITSGVGVLSLMYFVHQWYQSLPITSSDEPLYLKPHIRSQRLLNFINAFVGQTVRTHIFITLFALKWGVGYAAIISFIQTVTHTVTLLLKKTVNRMNSRLLTHTAGLQLNQQQTAFALVTYTTHQYLYAAAIILFINTSSIQTIVQTKQNYHIPITYILLLIALPILNQAYSYYETLFIANERNTMIIVCNMIITSTYLVSLSLSHSPLPFLISAVIIKSTVYLYLKTYAACVWQIRSAWTIDPRVIIGSSIMACCMWVCMQHIIELNQS